MPLQPQDSPLGAFLKALREEKIDCIFIGAMAAIEQGAPLMTVEAVSPIVKGGLMPEFTVEGHPVVMVTPELAGISIQ